MAVQKQNVDSAPLWLIIDAREAQSDAKQFGIARIITSLSRSLVRELSQRQENGTTPFPLKVLLVCKSAPPDWIVDLVLSYPKVVSYWSGGPGALTKKFDKPIWLWSTLVFKQLRKLTGDRFIWLSLANFDRPLFVSKGAYAKRVIQVVHDNIPFLPHVKVSFLFRLQFKMLVKRTLNSLPHVLSISDFSAKALALIGKKRKQPLFVIPGAVEELFGREKRIESLDTLKKQRLSFLLKLSGLTESEAVPFTDELKDIAKSIWNLGVGRSEKYKNWEVACEASYNYTDDQGHLAWFFRLGAGDQELLRNPKAACREVGRLKLFPTLRTVCLPALGDEDLAHLYNLGDLLLHPSEAEGFGLPPLEAALSGVPVIYRKGTAIDSHFPEGSLPEGFWCGVDSLDIGIWTQNIHKILAEKKSSSFYKELSHSIPREFIASGRARFEWDNTAQIFLDYLFAEFQQREEKSAS